MNGTVTSYLLDGDNVVQESSGGTTTSLLQELGTDNLLQRGSNWVIHGELNNVSAVTDAGGGSDEWCYYEPWGQMTARGYGSPIPYQFTGREADESGLMYYRARYYNPSWGRFVSQDPIGFAQVFAGADALQEGGPLAADDVRPEAPHPDVNAAGTPSATSPLNADLFSGAALQELAGFEMGANPFLYLNDNPITAGDPSGRMPDKNKRNRIKGDDEYSKMTPEQLDAAYNDRNTSKKDRQRIKSLQKENDDPRHRFVDLGDLEWGTAGVVTYEIFVWGGASLLAPVTGGWSYAGALALQ